ncbi:hypothetical protein [Sphingomonas sp. Leaf10]|nr:hypothetical protein [Sphingomonas sp. Leaf10]
MTTIQLAKKLAESNDGGGVKVSAAGEEKFRVPQAGNLFAKPG